MILEEERSFPFAAANFLKINLSAMLHIKDTFSPWPVFSAWLFVARRDDRSHIKLLHPMCKKSKIIYSSLIKPRWWIFIHSPLIQNYYNLCFIVLIIWLVTRQRTRLGREDRPLRRFVHIIFYSVVTTKLIKGWQ